MNLKQSTISFKIASGLIVLCALVTLGASVFNILPAPEPKASQSQSTYDSLQQSGGMIQSGMTGKDSPEVTIAVQDVVLSQGARAVIKWKATNNPKTCTASDDWSGNQKTSGTAESEPLLAPGEYLFTITCKTDKGTGYAVARAIVIGQDAGTGDPQRRPHVTLSAPAGTIQVGSSPKLTWSTTNSPYVCIASGDWTGVKNESGQQGLASIMTEGSKTYAMTCLNTSGMETVSVKIDVVSKAVATAAPATATASTATVYRPPTTTAPPATPTATPAPVVSISVSPVNIVAGNSATISWSVANGPATCTASGRWTGSKALSGSQSTGVIAASGVYDYVLLCSNARGQSSSGTARLSVSAPAPVVVYCGGKTPCYGRSDLAAHASPSSCWGWNGDWVIDITRYQPSHPVVRSASSTSNLANSSATCNHSITAILAGSAAIPGYAKSSGSTTHGHTAATTNNGATSQLAAFRVGFYDPNKP